MTIRSMDDLGRVVVPQSIRQELGWEEGTQLGVEIMDRQPGKVILRETELRCSLCRDTSKGLRSVKAGLVCPSCWEEISES